MKGLSEEVREIMKEYIGDNSVAGVAVLAVQDGKEICDCQEGMADIENGRVMKRDTIFRLYSQTKPVTGAAAMILMERGKLDLYQPVAEYLPAFREQKIWRNGRCGACAQVRCASTALWLAKPAASCGWPCPAT